MGYKMIDKENKRELKALDDEQLDMVAGGTGEAKEEDYLCRGCGVSWKSADNYDACPFCGSPNLAKGEEARI